MRKLLFALLVVLPFQARAIVISSSVGDLELTTVTGSYDSLASTLMSQVWWGNSNLAIELMFSVGTGLGTPNSIGSAPFGAFFGVCNGVDCLWDAPDIFTTQGIAWNASTSQGNLFATLQDNVHTWAIVAPTSVPEPGTLVLLAAGLGGLAFGWRRRKSRHGIAS